MNSLIADIGGYLGLLLGQSIMSMYDVGIKSAMGMRSVLFAILTPVHNIAWFLLCQENAMTPKLGAKYTRLLQN